MEINPLKQLEELVNMFGVKIMHLRSQGDSDAMYAEFDQGLRKFLEYPNNLSESFRIMERQYREKTLCIIKDSFEEYYMNFLLPQEYCTEQEKEFVQIGPYIMRDPEQIIDGVMEKNQLPIYVAGELKEYYYSVPLILDSGALEGVVLTQMGYMFRDREGLVITRMEEPARGEGITGKINWEEEDKLSTAAVETRYRYEKMMMEAVQSGDAEKVIEVSREFQRYRISPRSEDTLRNLKNLMVVWNTLLRKAVEQADVHPVYIDRISTSFAKQIENSTHITEFPELSRRMIRKYCLLVQNHSMKGHSWVVRDALNYIEFHIRETLSLKVISEQINVSSGYLSAQFKKEMGKTLTDYINEKRIHDSLILLNMTDLPIQEVAEQVGIHDENYYARLFKKYQGQTAKQYRTMMKLKN